MSYEVTPSTPIPSNSPLRASFGLSRPSTVDRAVEVLGMWSEQELVSAATAIINANAYGITYTNVVSYLHENHGFASVTDMDDQMGVPRLVFLYIEYLRHMIAQPPTPIRLMPHHPTNAPETDKQWLARCRAYIVQTLKKQVDAGEIRDTTTHRRKFTQYSASIGDLKAGETVWYNLRMQTGAMDLLMIEKDARDCARDRARAEKEAAKQARARDKAERDEQAKRTKAENLAAMHAAWDKAREAKAQAQRAKAEAKAEANRQAARKETTARYRANKKANEAQTSLIRDAQAAKTAPEHLRAAAELLQATQPQLAERLTAIANKLEADE